MKRRLVRTFSGVFDIIDGVVCIFSLGYIILNTSGWYMFKFFNHFCGKEK
jgi:hypothetical protein